VTGPNGAETSHTGQPAEGGPPFCLVVDDDPGICRAIAFTVRRLGFDVAEAGSLEALEAALARRSPLLIFLDLGLGKAGPSEAFALLAQHGYRGAIQLMSGRAQSVLDEVAALGGEYGLTILPALPKPFRMGVIKDLVAAVRLNS